MYSIKLFVGLLFLNVIACKPKEDEEGPGKSYSFTSKAKTLLKSEDLGKRHLQGSAFLASSGPKHICETGETITCTPALGLSGKYFAAGLLIQSAGKGMLAYLLNDVWSKIKSSSKTYDFDFANPIKSSGKLICCGGEGDLSDENTYFSNGAFLFAYLDATFEIPYTDSQLDQVPEEMKGEHTVRFVFATGAKDDYKLGDLLYKDEDGEFKWIDKDSGELSLTRPSSPVTMDKKVINYSSEDKAFESGIPTIYTELAEPSGGGVNQTSESKLKKSNLTYTFDFDPTYTIVIMLAQDEMTIIQDKKELFSRLHIQGLPHSKFDGFAAAGVSKLTIE